MSQKSDEKKGFIRDSQNGQKGIRGKNTSEKKNKKNNFKKKHSPPRRYVMF